jgi:RNA polymerase sigma-70 factor (ECF subfamily)
MNNAKHPVPSTNHFVFFPETVTTWTSLILRSCFLRYEIVESACSGIENVMGSEAPPFREHESHILVMPRGVNLFYPQACEEKKMISVKGTAENLDVEALYRRYGPMVMRRCIHLLRDEEEASDAMQETFVRVLTHRTTLHATYPSSLLYRIATNVCLNLMRTKRRRPAVRGEAFLEMVGVESQEERILDACLLEQVFQGAKESTRRTAETYYLECGTIKETARRVGLSSSGVRKRLRSLRSQSLALMHR